MKFIIGSISERKIKIAEKVIQELFSVKDFIVEGCNASSEVPETPYDKQTFDGARNRALDVKSKINDSDYYLGLESGLVERYGHIYEEAWAAVIDKSEKEYGNLPNDTWGTYSGGVILREKSLEEALRNALIQIVAPKDSFYKKIL